MSEHMRRIRIIGHGGPEHLEIEEATIPSPGRGEVLIEVAGAGVNRPDVLQRLGKYPPPHGASNIPGLEVSGTVVETGPGDVRFGVGDEVCALVVAGGYASHCIAPAAQCLPLPEGVGLVDAGGLPETYFTVWSNLFRTGRLAAGERVLIHGGASGIGTTAILLAKAFGAEVFTTAGSPARADACRALGADVTIDYRGEDFVDVVRQVTKDEGVHVVLDMVGGDYVERHLDVLAVEGRLIQIAWLGGARITADMTRLMTKRIVWTGSTLRARSVAFKGAIAEEVEQKVWPLFADGKLKPVTDRIYPLEQAAEAHRTMEAGRHVGKIILAP